MTRLSIAALLLLVTPAPSQSQTIELWAEAPGAPWTNCVSDNAGYTTFDLHLLYVPHPSGKISAVGTAFRLARGGNVQDFVPVSADWSPAMSVIMEDLEEEGITLLWQYCRDTTEALYLGKVTYQFTGQGSTPCSEIFIQNNAYYVCHVFDCYLVGHALGTTRVHVNPIAGQCSCESGPVPTKQTTWGGVKGEYKPDGQK